MKTPSPYWVIDSAEKDLVAKIHNSESSGEVAETTLRTDERVIARVTDGIYRRPGSAIRELISNAYDADATRVVIKTDAPRFDRITVEDNGHGMSPEVLAHMIFHIGGSAKRSKEGQSLGVAAADSQFHSPGGRRLIGKIGIGLFSVSQLTRTFQVITKVEGDNFRTIATIVLKQYADDPIEGLPLGEKRYESGRVNIWREFASDVDSHGTTIVLTSIRPQAKDTLRSRDTWAAIEQSERSDDSDSSSILTPPRFHIGRVSSDERLLKRAGTYYSSLPWDKNDDPEVAFSKLVQAVWDEIGPSGPNPKLERIFDNYLQMVWQLALSIPLPYVDRHLFDLEPKGLANVYELSNQPKEVATPVSFKKGQTIRERLALMDPAGSIGRFDIWFDEIKLARPLKFEKLPESRGALTTPLVFIGKLRETFEKIPREFSGGPLEFEAYLFWTPKIAPTEHQGALVRIHGSSGTLFDSTFLRYQTAELIRLRQITCEIFVQEGLEGALNIDRESFNASHPHSVFITKWLHQALLQLTNTQKKLAHEARQRTRDASKDLAVSGIQQVALDVWMKESGDFDSIPPQIEFTDSEAKARTGSDIYVFSRTAVIPEGKKILTQKQRAHEAILEEKLKSIAQVLAAYGLLDSLNKSKQEGLLRATYKILTAPEE
ncbi:MAG: ATP-binding protein [Ignavibacteriae bacterium]|nr:ATP-binding protein [Ignavibacteriota bacterium]